MVCLCSLVFILVLASLGEWERVYKWKVWYGGHPEFEFTGLLRRNTRTEVFVKEDGSWEYLEGQPIEGRGYVSYAPVPDCLYLLDRTCHGQPDLYVYSPREIRRKTFLGTEEVETYDEASRCFKIFDRYLGRNVTIHGWTREETIRTPMASICVRVLVPGKIKDIDTQGYTDKRKTGPP